MIFHRLFSACWYKHAPYPLIVVRGTHASWECRSCLADLGDVLPDQILKVKKTEKAIMERTCATAVVTPFSGARFAATARRK